MRRTILLLCGLLLLAPLAAGCVSAEASDTTPSQQALLVNAARSLSGVSSAQFDASASVSATQNGKHTGSEASLQGGVAKHAVSLDGTVKANAGGLAKTFPFGLRVTSKQLYVNVLGEWYSASLSDLKRQAVQRANGAAGPRKRQSLLEKLHTLMAANDIAGHAFKGEVSRGPELDGTDTWQWQGTLDPDGALAMVDKYGGTQAAQALGADKGAKVKQVLEQLAGLVTFTVVAGTDRKPRRVEVKIDADAAQIAALAKSSGGLAAQTGQLSDLHASLRIDLSHWNQPVNVTAPSGAKPIEQLFPHL